MSSEIWYRAEGQAYCTDETGRCGIEIHPYKVIRRTPRGVWLQAWYGGPARFALIDSRKRLAYPTKKEAVESLIARKKKQIAILSNRLEYAQRTLASAERLKSGEEKIPEAIMWLLVNKIEQEMETK